MPPSNRRGGVEFVCPCSGGGLEGGEEGVFCRFDFWLFFQCSIFFSKRSVVLQPPLRQAGNEMPTEFMLGRDFGLGGKD